MQHEDKLCAQCQRIKPHAQFKRLLTRAQTKARGYVGNHRVEIDSKLCKDCQPKPKPLERLTKNELRNRVASGDLHQMLADGVIKERNETVNQRRAAKMSSRWAERQSKEWRNLVRNIGLEITVVRQQLKYAQTIKDTVRQEYANTYLGMLNRLRARMRVAALKPQGAPESVYWVDHMHQEERNLVQEVWEKLPLDTRARMKVPLSMRHRVQDDSKPDLKLKGRDYVSPAERLKKAKV